MSEPEPSHESTNKNELTKSSREESFLKGLENSILRLQRRRPLLIIYYPEIMGMGRISGEDLDTLYEQFRNRGFSRDGTKIEELNVLLHTLGGSPDAAYMMAQIIRSFAKHVNFLVPFHAASAGTLMTFSGDKILFGAYAYLTPIDITVNHEGTEISLMAIEYFMDFAIDCRVKMETRFHEMEFDINARSRVDSDLLVKLVEQIDATTVGNLYRMRRLTEHYALLLLSDYMFKDQNIFGRAELISHATVFSFPAHEFNMDYNICTKIGLLVEQMKEFESEITKDIIRFLDNATRSNIICKQISENYRIPFIRLYDV